MSLCITTTLINSKLHHMAELIAKTLFGLEEVLAEELRSLGATGIRIYNRAVGFEAGTRILYKTNYCLRTALKILVPIGEADVKNETELYNYIRSISWENYLGVKDTLAVEVALSNSFFKHSQYVAQKIKDAVVDQFRDKFGSRPSVDLEHPTLRINAFINGNIIKLSRDSSGDSLHRRGYRYRQGPAPMNEVLAAGLIKLSGWNTNQPFVDFMCGSGTIAIEAALMACNIYPGDLKREYGFQTWKDYDPVLYNKVIQEGKLKPAISGAGIFASDISEDAVRLSMRHAQHAGVVKKINFQTSHLNEIKPPPPPGIVIVNPPYGERIVQENLNELYAEMGNKFKKDFAGYDAWIISANAEAVKHVGLRPSKKIQIYNGQLECRFNKYSLYEGTKKAGNLVSS
jgi:putative N6-adenine-specific DNA methylase